MKKITIYLLALCLLLSVPVNFISVSAEESAQKGAHSLDGAAPVLGSGRLVENVESAIVYELNSQTLMHAYNADKMIYPASFVKILTALIVCEQTELSATVTVRDDVLNTVDDEAFSVNLLAGETLTVEDLLYCMMVGSANDAAAVLADYVSGGQADFVAYMNQYAQEIGCTQTNFTNAHGLHDESQYSTIRDTARILSKAMENELFCTVFGATHYTVPQTNLSEERKLSTGNYLINDDTVEIYKDDRVTGGRTGVTASGYRCIATSAQSNGMNLICIITGAADVYEENGYSVKIFGGYTETSQLLDQACNGYSLKQILHKGQIINQKNVVNGDSDVVIATTDSVYAVLPQGIKSEDLDFKIVYYEDELVSPVEKDRIIAVLEVWQNNICIGCVDLCTMNSVSSVQNEMVEIRDRTEKKVWKTVVLIIFISVVGIVVILFVINAAFKAKQKAERNRRRMHRQDRRRSH